VKKTLRGRAGVATVQVQAVVLGATSTFDIAGPRRFSVINQVKDALEKGDTGKVDSMINGNQVIFRHMDEHIALIDAELAKDQPDESLVNVMRRQMSDGEVEDQGEKYTIIPLEGREFFDDAGTRKNPNYGKPMNYADRRRMFLLGRTISKTEVSMPKLMVVEARLDQCYLWDANPWDLVEGFGLRVRESGEVEKLATTRNTEWKIQSAEQLDELVKELNIVGTDTDKTRCELLLSAPESFQLTITQISEMYGQKPWADLMKDYDRFHIIGGDLLSKSDITIGFRNEFLAEGTEPDNMDYESKSINFWIPEDLEDQWNQFGNGSRVYFGGQLAERPVWDEEAGAISQETAPCLVVTCFAVVPELKEEP
jgi:hypothetical protein